MLVDELSLGLAPVIVERLMPIVAAYAKQSGCAVLVVEQHIHIALAVADRGYVLSHGELVIHAPADELRPTLVEQHIHIALAVADRGYVLSHGELAIHAPADQLRADHQLILSGYLGERTT